MKKSENALVLYRLGINWLIPSIYFGGIIAWAIYVKIERNQNLIEALGVNIFLWVVFLAWGFTNISQTIFIITVSELKIRKPFSPYLTNKRFNIEELRLVECRYQTGTTVQPSFNIHLKNGKRWFWWTGASSKNIKLFLAELKKLGVPTRYSSYPPWNVPDPEELEENKG